MEKDEMALRYSDKPQLHYGGQAPSKYMSLGKNLPAHARGMASAPTMSTRPIRLFEPDGKSRWGIHHADAWREVEVQRDAGGVKRVAMNGCTINAVAWASS
jgi:hypothetical protein